jgi:hypothetical protein
MALRPNGDPYGGLYPPQGQLGGPDPTEESWPGFSRAGDLSATIPLQELIALTGQAMPGQVGGQTAGLLNVIAQLAQKLGAEPTLDISHYQRLTQVPIPFTTTAPSSTPALRGSSALRTCLGIRYSGSSAAGSFLLISLDVPATDLSAGFSLSPGQVLFFDTAVPPNDIYLAPTALPANAVIVFANLPTG